MLDEVVQAELVALRHGVPDFVAHQPRGLVSDAEFLAHEWLCTKTLKLVNLFVQPMILHKNGIKPEPI